MPLQGNFLSEYYQATGEHSHEKTVAAKNLKPIDGDWSNQFLNILHSKQSPEVDPKGVNNLFQPFQRPFNKKMINDEEEAKGPKERSCSLINSKEKLDME